MYTVSEQPIRSRVLLVCAQLSGPGRKLVMNHDVYLMSQAGVSQTICPCLPCIIIEQIGSLQQTIGSRLIMGQCWPAGIGPQSVYAWRCLNHAQVEARATGDPPYLCLMMSLIVLRNRPRDRMSNT